MTNKEIIESYNYDRVKEEALGATRYTFRNQQGDYLDITLFDKAWFFLLDNFPFPKRKFSHDLPCTSLEQFETDLKRMGIPIPERRMLEVEST